MQKSGMFRAMHVEPNKRTDLDVGMDEDSVEGNCINGVHFSMDGTEIICTQIVYAIFDPRPELNETSLLPQAANLLYTPMTFNDIDGSALVDCGATNTFISRKFATRNNLPITKLSREIKDGSGRVWRS